MFICNPGSENALGFHGSFKARTLMFDARAEDVLYRHNEEDIAAARRPD